MGYMTHFFATIRVIKINSLIIIVSFCACLNLIHAGSSENVTTIPNLTALQIVVDTHKRYCRVEDNCNTSWSYDKNFCCKDCSCEPGCELNGTCCPDTLKEFWTAPKPEETPYRCISLSFKHFAGMEQPMIAKCLISFKITAVRKKCEIRSNASVLEDVLPVDDLKTNITCANKHCAECQGIPYYTYWKAGVQCIKSIFNPKSYNTLLADVSATWDCDIHFYSLQNIESAPCQIYISTCNETGLWENYDSFIERACWLYFAPYQATYRNPFCAICNGYDPNNFQYDDGWCGTGQPPGGASFAALLDFRPDQQQEDQKSVGKCSVEQLYDPVTVSDFVILTTLFIPTTLETTKKFVKMTMQLSQNRRLRGNNN